MNDIYFFLFQAHSGWRWIALIMLVVATLKVVVGWAANQKWSGLDAKLVSYTNMAVGIQVVLGIIMYIIFAIQGAGYTGKNVTVITTAHLIPGLLGFAGVAFASVRSKKVNGDRRKFMFASIGLIFAILMIYGALATVGGLFAQNTG